MKKEQGLKGLCNYDRKSFPSYSLKLVTKPQNAWEILTENLYL